MIGPDTSGRFRPRIRLAKSRKSSKNRQKCDFSKIDILFHSGRKYDIWPEIGPLDPGKPPESLYWPSYTIRQYFLKSEKNRIFDHQNRCKKIFLAEFSGRCGPATKAIPGINTPHTRPQTPIMLMYEPQPFLPICILKNSLSNAKRHFLTKMLFLLRFGCCVCCFSKSCEPGDVASYFYFLNMTLVKKYGKNRNFQTWGNVYFVLKNSKILFQLKFDQNMAQIQIFKLDRTYFFCKKKQKFYVTGGQNLTRYILFVEKSRNSIFAQIWPE